MRSRGAIHAVLDGADHIPRTSDDYDALLFSGNSGAGTPAKAGYPSIVVPGGLFDPTFLLPANLAFQRDSIRSQVRRA